MKLHTSPKRVGQQLNASCSFNDSTIPSLNAVTEWIREVSDELNELTEHRYNPSGVSEILDYNGNRLTLLTSRSPISDVVVSYNNAGSREEPNWVELSEYVNYIVEEDKGRITIQESSMPFRVGKKRFKIEYTAGIGDTPYWLQNLATRMVVKNLLQSQSNNRAVNDEGTQVRVGAVSVITPSEFGIPQYKALTESITTDLDKLSKMSRGVRYVNY